MSPKRRAGRRGQSSVVARLARRPSRNPFTSRGGARGESSGLQRLARRIGLRRALVGLFSLSLLSGMFASKSVIHELQGDATDAAPVLVQSLAVQGNERLDADDIAMASGLSPESLASEVDPEQIARNLEAHEMIRSARAAALPTGKVIVRVEERQPVAIVRAPESEGEKPVWRLVDVTGTPFARAEGEEWSRLPRLRSAAALPSDQTDATLVRALALASMIRKTDGPDREAREIELPSKRDGLGWVLHSRALPHTVILGEEELEPRLGRLALLLASNMPPARAAEEIDLRFADQAVLRSRSPSR